MKTLILITLITVAITIIWFSIGTTVMDRQYMVEKKALDLSIPFSATIDIEFLKGLKESSQSTQSTTNF
ncbi:MAG TPA: hypothetical protein VLI92_04235 [Candidatus Saccharimonadales bacterium]|nr:hypothetical protein [Candidatus Saccharimonadales bacterium]